MTMKSQLDKADCGIELCRGRITSYGLRIQLTHFHEGFDLNSKDLVDLVRVLFYAIPVSKRGEVFAPPLDNELAVKLKPVR